MSSKILSRLFLIHSSGSVWLLLLLFLLLSLLLLLSLFVVLLFVLFVFVVACCCFVLLLALKIYSHFTILSHSSRAQKLNKLSVTSRVLWFRLLRLLFFRLFCCSFCCCFLLSFVVVVVFFVFVVVCCCCFSLLLFVRVVYVLVWDCEAHAEMRFSLFRRFWQCVLFARDSMQSES
ncbi:unnamed protein product [Polarella glacialis]|uniref:Uncharacterized protein n=1 Tax=Polarella glacialis TaxID=89957 RepID=A0A813GJN8_POLGL|nr:unnamed protein product [Polarella glacialis]